MPLGQAYPYDPVIAAIIWERIATDKIGLENVLDMLKNEGLTEGFTVPSKSTWYLWLRAEPEMQENSARARLMQSHYVHGLAITEATTERIGERTKTLADGSTETTTGDNVERSKLAYQAYMRLAGSLNAKEYGDKVAVAHTAEDGGPVQFVVRSILDEPLKNKE